MTRICHLAPGHDHHHMRIYYRFCLSLAQADYDVILVAHPDDQTHDTGPVRFCPLKEDYSFSLKWRLKARLQRNADAYHHALAAGAQLYMFHSPEFIPWALWLKWRTRKPVVFDCMEDFEGYIRQRRGIPNLLRRPLALAIRIMLRWAARLLDAIIVADPGTAAYFQPYAQETVTIYNFPRLELFTRSTMDSQPEFDLVYHGSIPRYHLELLLNIDECLLKKGRKVSWYLFGTVAELNWFESEIRSRNIEDRFYLKTHIAHHQVASEVCRARIGIIPLPDLPKFRNNIPQKLFEYMALNLPVVLSDLPPSRPFIEDAAVGIMVQPDHVSAYADVIMQLLENPVQCQQMGLEGRKRVEQAYNWEIESHKLLHLCAKLLNATLSC